MSKITLSSLPNLQNETTAVTTINNNFSILQTAFDNTLSRDGTSPNQMTANIDLNSHQILNQVFNGFTFSTLPSPTLGRVAFIIDGPASQAWGATISSGGGSTSYLLWYNGTAWTVIGK